MVSLGVSHSIVSRLGRALSTNYIVTRTRFYWPRGMGPWVISAPELVSALDSRLVLASA